MSEQRLPDCSVRPKFKKKHRPSCGLFLGRRHGDLFRDPLFISYRIKARHNFEWTPEAVQEAAALWSRGLIKSKMAAHFCVTRESIVGMMMRHRQYFPLRIFPKRQNRERYISQWKTAEWKNKLKTAAALWRINFTVRKISVIIEVSPNQLSGAIHRNRDLFPPRPSPIKRGVPR